jgi:hypothetical protein
MTVGSQLFLFPFHFLALTGAIYSTICSPLLPPGSTLEAQSNSHLVYQNLQDCQLNKPFLFLSHLSKTFCIDRKLTGAWEGCGR